MKNFSVRVTIRSTPECIWTLLTDAAAYTRRNNTVEKVEGNIALGERVTIRTKINQGKTFLVTVSGFEPPRRMVWTGGMPFGLFKGVRTFLLMPDSNGNTEFSMREEYSGLMAPFISPSIPDLQPAFDEFASDLEHADEMRLEKQ
jgi:hypothetical protein